MRTCFTVALLALILIGCDRAAPTATKDQPKVEEDVAEAVAQASATSEKICSDTPIDQRYPKVPKNEPLVNRDQAGVLDDDGWCRATSQLGKFSVDMPGKFEDSIYKIDNEKGYSIRHSLTYLSRDLKCVVMKFETEKLTDADIVEDTAAKVRKQGGEATTTEIQVQGRPAKKLVYKTRLDYAKMVVIKFPDAEFSVMCQAYSDSPEVRKSVDRVIESFSFETHVD